MQEKISALMDGELSGEDAASVIDKFEETDGLREQWAVYHLISDVLEHSEARHIDVSPRVSARLAVEPAASIAAVVAAGWMSLQTTQAPHQQLSLADARTAPANSTPVIPAASPAPASAPVQINDYLLAHREFSPSTAMHGVAPYTRTVAESREHFGR
jgi:sigma-E factor negative regulatory protein RseA